MKKLNQIIAARRNGQKGATAIEYALIAALIAVAIIGAVQLVGNDISATFNKVASSLPNS